MGDNVPEEREQEEGRGSWNVDRQRWKLHLASLVALSIPRRTQAYGSLSLPQQAAGRHLHASPLQMRWQGGGWVWPQHRLSWLFVMSRTQAFSCQTEAGLSQKSSPSKFWRSSARVVRLRGPTGLWPNGLRGQSPDFRILVQQRFNSIQFSFIYITPVIRSAGIREGKKSGRARKKKLLFVLWLSV